MFTSANPTQFIIKEADNSLHIILTVVLVKQKAGQFPDCLNLLVSVERSRHLLSLTFEDLRRKRLPTAAAMSLIGTLAGTFGGILVSNKLTSYRLAQLEQKVAAHNSLVERTYKLEGQMTEVQHDIRDLKAERG